MVPSRSVKPLVSAGLALLFVLAFVLPFMQVEYLAGPSTPFDVVQAGAIRWGAIIGFGLIWLAVQLFWRAPTEATKLGMAASVTIVWLSLAFFFNYNPPEGNFDLQQYGGAVAFFTLMGGLGIVLLWTRFLSDELHF
ncbi:MAG: hypothetical protein IVW57_13300 [Ktedonobacterales bacterium]|nr:hypothetical protein [Ktedonobacterales bacterium]